MASSCIRFVSRRVSFCSLRSLGVRSPLAAPPPHFVGGACATRRFTSLFRIPVELGCCGGSMFPLHSAVAAARLTSRLSATSRSDRALSQGILCRTSPGL